MRREVLPQLVRYTLTEVGKGGGLISWSDLTADNADSIIQNQIDYFKELNVDFEWKYYSHDQPGDLPARLMAHGFKTDQPEALMVAEIARMYCEVWNREIIGFAKGMKYDLAHYTENLSVFAVWQEGRVVSTAWPHYMLSTSFATLWGGSTLKQYRKRGYYTALLAVRAREARERGYRFLQVDASSEIQPILTKHGFRCLAYSTPYEWTPK